MESASLASTRWSLVLAAQREPAADSAAALAFLCNVYWPLLYAYARGRGHAIEDAQDLTQAFFSLLLEKRFLNQARRQRGKFRAFLYTAFKHFLANEWDRQQAQKRGGGLEFLSLEELARAEREYAAHAVAAPITPDKLYERRWALTLLERAAAQLADEFSAAGKSALFLQLKPFLTGDGSGPNYATVAESLGMSDVAVRVSVHRLRGRFRDLLRSEIAETLENPEDPGAIEEELRYLLTAL